MTTYRYCHYCLVGIPSRYFKTHGCTDEGKRKRLQAIMAAQYQWKEIYYTDEEEL